MARALWETAQHVEQEAVHPHERSTQPAQLGRELRRGYLCVCGRSHGPEGLRIVLPAAVL